MACKEKVRGAWTILCSFLALLSVAPDAFSQSAATTSWTTKTDASLRSRCQRERDVRVFVEIDADASERTLDRLGRLGCKVEYRFSCSSTVSLRVRDASMLRRIASIGGVSRIEADAAGRIALAESIAHVGADRLGDLGLDGDGHVVALLDTGIDAGHPDLAGAVLLGRTFLDGVESEDSDDDNGHGTHVAGILTSDGAVASSGVAPGVRIVSVKVVDENGVGSVSDWVAGLEYVIEVHDADNGVRIDAVNMSLSTDRIFRDVCNGAFGAFEAACVAAADRGIVLVAATGNGGSPIDWSAPSCYETVISVASVGDSHPDEVSSFSNRTAHLDLLAPGADITSSWPPDTTRTLAGTSYAAPHVTGVACLLRQSIPDLSPQEIRRLLRLTGVPVEDAGNGSAFPRLDAASAVALTLGGEDCDENGRPDALDLALGTNAASDCNENGVLDICDVAAGRSTDVDGDGLLDECEPSFHRADPNDDGLSDVSDALLIVRYAFQGGERPGCLESADVNHDANVDIADAISLVMFLFLGGEPPPAPGPPAEPCGPDPDAPNTRGDLGCDAYESCT